MNDQKETESVKQRIKMPLTAVFFGHLIFGLGVYFIGWKMKNNMEMLLGLFIFLIGIVMFFAGSIFVYYRLYVSLGSSLFSWAYIIVRLWLLYKGDEIEFTILPSK